MAKYLSQEWLDESRLMAADQPERPGASVKMNYVVTGAPEGEVTYHWILENGKLVDSKLGGLDGAEVTLTMTYEDAVKQAKGELDPNAAFMQGRVKVTGNMAKLMSLLPLTNAPEYKELQAKIAEITDF